MRFLLLLVLLIGSLCSSAQLVKITSAPDWIINHGVANAKTIKADEVSNGYVLKVYEKQVNLINQTVYNHQRRKIYNETGVQNASDVSVSFAPQYEHVNFHHISLIRNGKTISNVKLQEIKVVDEENEADEFLYNGTKRAYVVLKGVQKDDEIDFAYSVSGFNPVFGNHYTDKIYFVSYLQIESYFESIIAPTNLPLFFRSFNDAPEPEIRNEGNRKVYQWNNPAIGAWDFTASAPAWYQKNPYIAVSTFNDWREVISWGTKLFRNYDFPLPKELTAYITQWRRAAGGDKYRFATAAVRFVQEQVRYLGLEIGTHTHEPHSPAEVFEQRFGDCKDKALLLATILRQENIPAYVALVNTSSKTTLGGALPSAGLFDHAIVAVKNEEWEGYRYIDPTITGQRGEFESLYVPEYGFALVLNEKEIGLQQASAIDHNTSEISEVFHLSFTDTCRLKVKTTFSGKVADDNRNNLRGTSIKELSESYLDFYSKFYEGILSAAPIVVRDDSVHNELKIEEAYAIASPWVIDEYNRKVFSFTAQPVSEKLPNPTGLSGQEPIALEYPLKIVYSIQLYMPEEWPMSFSELHIKNDAYQFDFTPRVDGNIIYLEYYLKTLKDHIPASMISAYKQDYERMIKKMEYGLYSSPQSGKKPGGRVGISISAITFSLIFLSCLAFFLGWLSRKSVDVEFDENTAWTIGGWTGFLGATLVVSVIVQIFSLFKGGYFQANTWDLLGASGGIQLQAIGMTELVLSEFWLLSGTAVIVWFFKRRDIFPKMFTWYVMSLMIGKLILIAAYLGYPANDLAKDYTHETTKQLLQNLVYAGIWVTYVQRSQRVKNTFLKSYAGSRADS